MLTQEELNVYAERAAVLRALGFYSYEAYLKSDLWQEIRHKILAPAARCCGCNRKPTQVHHARYSMNVMMGKDVKYLVPVCGTCHHKSEFDNHGEKLGPQRATVKLNSIRRSNTKPYKKSSISRENLWRKILNIE